MEERGGGTLDFFHCRYSAVSTVAQLLPFSPMLLNKFWCFVSPWAVLSNCTYKLTEPACFWKSWSIIFWCSPSQLFKHNKMYINSSSRGIRGNRATYGGVVRGQRRNKSCSKCADTFSIVLPGLPNMYIPAFHSVSGWWCTVGAPSP